MTDPTMIFVSCVWMMLRMLLLRRCVVVEDSRIGMMAAKSAGMVCVITKSSYTQNEDFGAADAVFDCIGESGEQRFSLNDLALLLSGDN
jgi:beta-phosphoglucomutase-like phosphatase (HAD superfamily)